MQPARCLVRPAGKWQASTSTARSTGYRPFYFGQDAIQDVCCEVGLAKVECMGKRVMVALMLCVAGALDAQQPSPPELPPVVHALPAPPSRQGTAIAVLAPYRYDDLLWENDRTAH